MLKIRLTRRGKKNKAFFRLVVAEQTSPIKGKFIEALGFLNPHTKEKSLKSERIKYWMEKGAQCSDSAHNMLVKEGIVKGPKRAVKMKKKEPASSADKAENKKEVASPADKEDVIKEEMKNEEKAAPEKKEEIKTKEKAIPEKEEQVIESKTEAPKKEEKIEAPKAETPKEEKGTEKEAAGEENKPA